VRSIVGRFLEHSRVAYFHAGGEGKVFLASADWMERNLHRRVETCFPLTEPELAGTALRDGIETYLEDDCQAWILGADGRYTRSKPALSEPRVAQTILRRRLSGLGGRKPDPGGEQGGGLGRKVG